MIGFSNWEMANAAKLLNQTLTEERKMDRTLPQLGESKIKKQAQAKAA